MKSKLFAAFLLLLFAKSALASIVICNRSPTEPHIYVSYALKFQDCYNAFGCYDYSPRGGYYDVFHVHAWYKVNKGECQSIYGLVMRSHDYVYLHFRDSRGREITGGGIPNRPLEYVCLSDKQVNTSYSKFVVKLIERKMRDTSRNDCWKHYQGSENDFDKMDYKVFPFIKIQVDDRVNVRYEFWY